MRGASAWAAVAWGQREGRKGGGSLPSAGSRRGGDRGDRRSFGSRGRGLPSAGSRRGGGWAAAPERAGRAAAVGLKSVTNRD
uniref:Uncharacterized protein n=1 Tax=Oryza sativa subsp. japonica TaxID=39947 RepID=Q5Z5M0_ORYSJ|nr:hypothetical protein [Oryza sativa Japonica Group]